MCEISGKIEPVVTRPREIILRLDWQPLAPESPRVNVKNANLGALF